MVTDEMLIAEFDLNDLQTAEPNHLLKLILTTKEDAVKKFLTAKFPDIDFDTYEDGFHNWWGMSSVFGHELGLGMTINIHYNKVEVTIC